METKNKIQEYFYTLKVSGLRFWVWFVPFWLIIPIMRQFTGYWFKYENGNRLNGIRLGNSGIFLIFSQEVQDKIRENINRNRKAEKEWEKENLKKKLEELEE